MHSYYSCEANNDRRHSTICQIVNFLPTGFSSCDSVFLGLRCFIPATSTQYLVNNSPFVSSSHGEQVLLKSNPCQHFVSQGLPSSSLHPMSKLVTARSGTKIPTSTSTPTSMVSYICQLHLHIHASSICPSADHIYISESILQHHARNKAPHRR
jgi:hypothetical protein